MSTLDSIKIVKNFIEKEDIDIFIKYINNNLNKFYIDPRSNNGIRYSYKFGKNSKKNVHPESKEVMEDLHEIYYLINKYVLNIAKTVKEKFNDEKDLFLSSFWMAKQNPGAIVDYHKDTDQDDNLHFKYSVVLYLNTMPKNSGMLKFPNLSFEYFPEGGDMIMFPSQGEKFVHGVDIINQERYTLSFWLTEDKNFILI